MDNKKIIDKYLSELNDYGLPYKATLVQKNKNGSFDLDGLSSYDDVPNVSSIFLLEGLERNKTQEDNKFLLIEIYDRPTADGKYFGVPAFSYIHDVLEDNEVSCYMIDDENVALFDNIIEATSHAIKAFEFDNYQRIMSTDYIVDNIDYNDDEIDNELASLCIAESVIRSFNGANLELFKTELNFDEPKLTISCEKYDNWVDIIDTGEKGNIHEQIVHFANDNYLNYIKEAVDHAKIYCLNDLKTSKKNVIKPT
jgi:hypothetical protein